MLNVIKTSELNSTSSNSTARHSSFYTSRDIINQGIKDTYERRDAVIKLKTEREGVRSD